MSEFDSKEFQEVLLTELLERIEELNNGLLKLERDPSDEIVNEDLLRTLHNLKGLFSLAGYPKISTIAHSIETLLINMESKNIQNVTKIIFRFSDELEKFAKGLKKGSAPDLLSFDQINFLISSIDDIMIKLGNNLLININFDPECKVISSRSMVLLDRLRDLSTINRTEPTIEEIEEGHSFTDLVIELTTREDDEKIENICYEVQDVVSVLVTKLLDSISTVSAKETKIGETPESLTIRVNIGILDNIIQLLGDLIVYGQFLRDVGQQLEYSKPFRENLTNFEKTISNIQDLIVRMRLVPLETILNRFPRMVRDLSEKEEKNIELIIMGKEIGIDRSVIEKLVDPLTHLIRNAISHGIEKPEERRKKNKDPIGVIKILVSHQRSDIIIEINDNGKGLDYNKIKDYAKKAGILQVTEELSYDQLHKLLLTSSLSTVDKTTELSGRGIGLSTVKEVMNQIGGEIEIDSKPNQYTSFRLIIPISVAIMKVLKIKVNNHEFGFPLANIEQILSVSKEDIAIDKQNNTVSVIINSEYIPVVDLRDRLTFYDKNGLSDSKYSNSYYKIKDQKNIIVLWRKGTKSLGFLVDDLKGEVEIVLKPIGNILNQIGDFSGASILEGGRVIFILEPTNYLEVDLLA